MPSVPAYYSDILRWLPIMKEPSKYFSTPGVNEIRAFCRSDEDDARRRNGGAVRPARANARAIRAALPPSVSVFHRGGIPGGNAVRCHLSAGVEDRLSGRRSARTASSSPAGSGKRRAGSSAWAIWAIFRATKSSSPWRPWKKRSLPWHIDSKPGPGRERAGVELRMKSRKKAVYYIPATVEDGPPVLSAKSQKAYLAPRAERRARK